MEKLQNTIIRCTGVLCGVILFVHAILNYFLPDAISVKKTPDEK